MSISVCNGILWAVEPMQQLLPGFLDMLQPFLKLKEAISDEFYLCPV